MKLNTCTLCAGINWTMFADEASTADDGEGWCCNDVAFICDCCCCCWCDDGSSELACVDGSPNGSKLELPFSSTMLPSIATMLPYQFNFNTYFLTFRFVDLIAKQKPKFCTCVPSKLDLIGSWFNSKKLFDRFEILRFVQILQFCGSLLVDLIKKWDEKNWS